jgi:hypothetical protein
VGFARKEGEAWSAPIADNGSVTGSLTKGVAEVDGPSFALHHLSPGFAEPGYRSSETARVMLQNYRELFTKEAV